MKKIAGYEDYQITKSGEIFSFKNGNKIKLKQTTVKRSHTNYKQVMLYAQGTKKVLSVHRLVAIAFVDNPDNKPYVNHIDNNGENNHYSNLEWCTQKENILHSERQNRMSHRVKAGLKGAKSKYIRKRTKVCMLIGSIVGSTKLLSVDRSDRSNKHIMGVLECIRCGNVRHTNIERFINNDAKACRACNTSMMWRKKRFDRLKI